MKKEIILDAIETKLIQESRETAAAEQAVQHFVHDQDLARALSLSLSDSAASAVRTVYAVAREGRDNATALAELNAVTDAMRASEATFALEEGSRSLRVEANAAKFFDDTVEFDLAERAYAQAQQSNADRDMALAVAASLSCDLAQNLPWPRRGFSPETVHAVEHGMSALSLTSPELEIEREVTIDETYLSLDPGGDPTPPSPDSVIGLSLQPTNDGTVSAHDTSLGRHNLMLIGDMPIANRRARDIDDQYDAFLDAEDLNAQYAVFLAELTAAYQQYQDVELHATDSAPPPGQIPPGSAFDEAFAHFMQLAEDDEDPEVMELDGVAGEDDVEHHDHGPVLELGVSLSSIQDGLWDHDYSSDDEAILSVEAESDDDESDDDDDDATQEDNLSDEIIPSHWDDQGWISDFNRSSTSSELSWGSATTEPAPAPPLVITGVMRGISKLFSRASYAASMLAILLSLLIVGPIVPPPATPQASSVHADTVFKSEGYLRSLPVSQVAEDALWRSRGYAIEEAMPLKPNDRLRRFDGWGL